MTCPIEKDCKQREILESMRSQIAFWRSLSDDQSQHVTNLIKEISQLRFLLYEKASDSHTPRYNERGARTARVGSPENRPDNARRPPRNLFGARSSDER